MADEEMTGDSKNLEDIIQLLQSYDLAQAMESSATIVLNLCQAEAVCVLIWDSDLETFSDQFVFGSQLDEMHTLVERFCQLMPDSTQTMQGVDPAEFGVSISESLLPIVCYRVFQGNNLSACILIAKPNDAQLLQLEDDLNTYPFAHVLSQAWEYRELKRENERLRSQYEHLEDSISAMEEQTRKLIHDITIKDALHTRKIERERLVYSISNAVRSSLRIQDVLQTVVNQIGRSLSVSRCLLLKPYNGNGNLTAYEYFAPNFTSSLDLFSTDEGKQFVQLAMSRGAPQDLSNPQIDRQDFYDQTFLNRFALKSGLLVPLILRDTNLGVLFLQDCQANREWSIDDTALLGALADLLCVAIENAELHEERQQQAVTDGLTGVFNRRHFNEVFHLEFERSKRYGQPLSLIIADLDHLKQINDRHGHQVGDQAIQAIAQILRNGSRSIDLTARYGGEEFCLLLPNTDLSMAEQTAERLCQEISQCHIDGPGQITASIGVASFPNHAESPDRLFAQADEALYQAKQSGRNRVCLASLK